MQRIVSKYGLGAHLAILAVAPLFLSPSAVFAVSILCAIWIVMEPSRVGKETLPMARQRVLLAIKGDPVFWSLVVCAGFATLCYANGGVGLAYDAETGEWTMGAPYIRLFPGSTSPAGVHFVAASFAALVVVTGCRRALGRAARDAFIALAALFAGLVALHLSLQLPLRDPEALALARCGLDSPVFAGSLFGVYLLAAVAIIPNVFAREWYGLFLASALSVCGNALALFLYAPPIVSAFWAVLGLIALVYSIVRFYCVYGASSGLSVMLATAFPLAVAALLFFLVMPAAVVGDKTDDYFKFAFIPDGYGEMRAMLNHASAEMWRDSPWVGKGVGAFADTLRFHVRLDDWGALSSEQKAPLGAYWLVLSERGSVGALVLGMPLLLLLAAYFRRLVATIRSGVPPPLALVGLLTFAAVVVEAFFDASLLRPGMILAVSVLLTISAGAFLKEKVDG